MLRDTGLIERSLDALDDVFYVYDAEERLIGWNDRLNDLFGLSDEELDGMAPAAFFLEADRPAVERAVAEIRRTGETTVEARAETTEGLVLFQLTGRLLTDEAGDPIGFAGVGRDITTQREYEWRLARQNDRLSEVSDVLAHDIRNPLAVALGYVNLERERGASSDLDKAAVALERIEAIVSEVLTAAREGRTVSDPIEVDLGAVSRAAWDAVDTDGATLSCPEDVTLRADPERLQRILENLFRNAVEHGPAGNDDGGDAEGLTVGVGPLSDGHFYVADDGVGIPVTERDRVFARGFSGTTAGTGIGLGVVRALAEAHGWTVAAVEGEGGGARFEFRSVSLPATAPSATGP